MACFTAWYIELINEHLDWNLKWFTRSYEISLHTIVNMFSFILVHRAFGYWRRMLACWQKVGVLHEWRKHWKGSICFNFSQEWIWTLALNRTHEMIFCYSSFFILQIDLIKKISQCTIQNRIVYISVMNGALWDRERVHCAFCEIGILSLPSMILYFGHRRK